MSQPELSVLVPVYNEAATVDELLRRVLAAPYRKQVIVVDDGSTDATRARLEAWRGVAGVEVIFHERNRGKGAAIRTALARAIAPLTIVQDADLEYDPNDFPKLIEPLQRGDALVVYGTRYHGDYHQTPWTRFRLGVHALNGMVRLLYGARITDEATCYKALRTDLLKSLNLRCERFEFCPEVTAGVLKRGVRILEVPIRFRHRTIAEGKKIGWRDWIEAMWTLLRLRFTR